MSATFILVLVRNQPHLLNSGKTVTYTVEMKPQFLLNGQYKDFCIILFNARL